MDLAYHGRRPRPHAQSSPCSPPPSSSSLPLRFSPQLLVACGAVLLLLPALAAAGACRFAVHTAHADAPPHHATEVPTFDGFYNNLAAVSLGGSELPLLRAIPARYADGVHAPSNPLGPNARTISRALFEGGSGSVSKLNRTVLLTHYGQHIVEEIVNAMPPHCTPE